MTDTRTAPVPLLERIAASPPVRELVSWSLIGAGAFALVSLASFDAHDYAGRAYPVAREPLNWGGAAGRSLSAFGFDWVGIGASYLAALSAIAVGVRLRWAAPARPLDVDAAGRPVPWAGLAFVRPLGALAVLLGAAMIEHLLHRQGAIAGESFPGRNPGGFWGAFLAAAILKNFDPSAGYGLACCAATIGGALALDLDLGGRRRRAAGRVAAPVPAPAMHAAPVMQAAPAMRAAPVVQAAPAMQAAPVIKAAPPPIQAPPTVRATPLPLAGEVVDRRSPASPIGAPPTPAPAFVVTPARPAPAPAEAPPPAAAAPRPIEIRIVAPAAAPRPAPETAIHFAELDAFDDLLDEPATPARFEAEPEPSTISQDAPTVAFEAPPLSRGAIAPPAAAPAPTANEPAPAAKPAARSPKRTAGKASRKPVEAPAIVAEAAGPASEPERVLEPARAVSVDPPAEPFDSARRFAPRSAQGERECAEAAADPVVEPIGDPIPDPIADLDADPIAAPIVIETEPLPPPPPARYALPPLDMLAPSIASPADAHEALLREKAAILERALQSFRIDGRVVAVERGPNITQFEIELAPGIKVHRLLSLDSDIAMAMKAPNVRIIAPIPGKSTVGVEVPNQDQETVRLRELIESGVHDEKGLAIPLFLGKDATGNPLVADLARMPHLLIAGATGSGKSVCMNTVITSILLTRGPSDVKMILIDPKMVELSLYASVPHLLAPVVTDMPRAPAVLEWAVEKMEERYSLLQRAAVRHIKSYNALTPEEISNRLRVPIDEFAAAKVPTRLSYIVVVIDEFADLMCVARKEVEKSIIRLAQKSRAVGIHLILATQRPTADVITGLIKSNMPCRIAFQVASKVDSRNILDKNGAESLVGQGDMLFLLPGTSSVIRAQGTYVSDDEVKSIVDHARGAAPQQFQEDLLRAQEAAVAEEEGEGGGASGEGGAGLDELSGDDPLFDDAVRVVLESKRGSASLLQRRLEVGYARASRLIDLMSERGILGPFKGSKARELLTTLAAWDALKASERGVGEAA